jgi:site-specific DNA-methyltransferase (cytosine-N4-specific)
MALDYAQLNSYISEHIVTKFYEIRITKLQALRLHNDILRRKNPYLFKAKNITTSEAFVRSALDAFLSSQEETLFGNLLETLAIYVCGQVYGGTKAEIRAMPSIDLVFTKSEVCYVVGIKSGPYWGNNDQIKAMKRNFKLAKDALKARGITAPIVAVNGCIYGKDNQPFKQDPVDPELSYYRYCGQEFWEFISGDPDLYITIIQPLDLEAKRRGPEFMDIYDAKVNQMTLEFGQKFLANGQIDWQKLIQYVSQRRDRF